MIREIREKITPETHPELFLKCRECGQANCGRLIEKADGSIRAMLDTGYRYKVETNDW